MFPALGRCLSVPISLCRGLVSVGRMSTLHFSLFSSLCIFLHPGWR